MPALCCQLASECAGVPVNELRQIWIHACVTRLQTDIVYFGLLRGVEWAAPLRRWPMRNPRHESRRLHTKEILLTPNHKKRGVKKKQEKNPRRSPLRSARVILRERDLCDIDRIVHKRRRFAGVHAGTVTSFVWARALPSRRR